MLESHMSPYGGMFVEQSKFLPSDSDSQCNMDVSRHSHGSLIFLAFGTRRLVEQGHGSLIFLVWATQESRICDFERDCAGRLRGVRRRAFSAHLGAKSRPRGRIWDPKG